MPSNSAQVDTDEYVGYVHDPNGRGTAGLLLSCFATLILCVWSALHLNVPHQKHTNAQWIILNIKWIVVGIYCPELVVFTAWRQWSSARLLQRHVADAEQAEAIKDNKSSIGEGPEWTMLHSFFACAGGFALEIDALNDDVSDPAAAEDQRPRRLTITARGMMLLARHGKLPRVSKAEIEDKSKANDLAKATVIVQATWMLVQTIGRLIARLPVTLLEVNTVAHVLCTFAMYLFWWHKPLLPKEPIVLRDAELAPLASMMFSSSEVSGRQDMGEIKSQTVIKTLFAHLNLFSTTPEMETLCFVTKSCETHTEPQRRSIATETSEGAHVDDDCSECSTSERTGFYSAQRAAGHCLQEIEADRQKEKGTAFFERRPRVITRRHISRAPSASMLHRWELTESAFCRYPDLFSERISMKHVVAGSQCVHLRPEQLLATHVQNWPSSDLLRNVNGLMVGMVLWLANFCYGGLHAAAWNEHFPSTVEKWLWRVAASYIGFCGGLWVLLNFIVIRFARLNAFWEKWMDGRKGVVQSFGIGFLVFVCGFSLVLARLFLVVEAFASLRELPRAAYDTPNWSDVFPHL